MDFRIIGDALAKRAMDEQNIQGDTYVRANSPIVPAADDKSKDFALLMAKVMGTAITEHVPAYAGTVTLAPDTGTEVDLTLVDGTVLEATTGSTGLDLPVPSIVVQVDGSEALVALWWKSGPDATDWINIATPQWEQIVVDPTAGAGLARPLRTIVWQNNTGSPALPVALWLKNGSGNTAWFKLWPISTGSAITLSTELPLEDGVADPGDTSSGEATAKRHVHPDKETVGGDLYFIGPIEEVPIVYYASDIVPDAYSNPRLAIAPVGVWDLSMLLTFGGHGVIGG